MQTLIIVIFSIYFGIGVVCAIRLHKQAVKNYPTQLDLHEKAIWASIVLFIFFLWPLIIWDTFVKVRDGG